MRPCEFESRFEYIVFVFRFYCANGICCETRVTFFYVKPTIFLAFGEIISYLCIVKLRQRFCSNDGMVDMRDLKSLGHCARASSSLASSTLFLFFDFIVQMASVVKHVSLFFMLNPRFSLHLAKSFRIFALSNNEE